MKYFAYTVLVILSIKIYFKVLHKIQDIKFAKENKKRMQRRKKLQSPDKASIELVNQMLREMLREIIIKSNIENL